MDWVDRILIALMFLSVGFIAGVVTTWQPLPIDVLWRDYKDVYIFEDGSWRANARNGLILNGCIQGALCDNE